MIRSFGLIDVMYLLAAARSVGMTASTAADTLAAVSRIATDQPGARILICGSLYLAGQILRPFDA